MGRSATASSIEMLNKVGHNVKGFRINHSDADAGSSCKCDTFALCVDECRTREMVSRITVCTGAIWVFVAELFINLNDRQTLPAILTVNKSRMVFKHDRGAG